MRHSVVCSVCIFCSGLVTASLAAEADPPPVVTRYLVQRHSGPSNYDFVARYASASPASRGNKVVFYEICNVGEKPFLFRWDELWGVVQGQSILKGECPWVAIATPNGVKEGNASILYSADARRNAVVHVPIPDPPAGTVTGFLENFLGKKKSPSMVGPDDPKATAANASVVMVEKDQGKETYHWVEIKEESVSRLALKMIREDPAIAKEFARTFRATNGGATGSVLKAEELRKSISKEDWEVLPERFRSGDYIVLVKTTDQASAEYSLPKKGGRLMVAPAQAIAIDKNGKVQVYYHYSTFKNE
ncbi:hypothetical protein ACSFBF_28105 [Variovorax sp. ZT5P49]|uniref:hypothetical protein n=1 Tax=Variovorax sp. ZT5P49 TaxID=3443733 RepID=UPI003F45223B